MTKSLAALPMAAIVLATIVVAFPAHARRGGGPDFMHSPSYQRALADGRKAYREQYLQQQRTYEPRKKRYGRR